MRSLLRLLLLASLALAPARAQLPQATADQLEALRQRFPAADSNKDGKLTQDEALAYAQRIQQQQRRPTASSVAPAPTVADASYGPHERNVLDFWRAPSATAARPAPVVVYIHGGGFISGDKSRARQDRLVQQCLDAGVSFAAINYRFLGPSVPVQDLLRDCARAIQFLRSQSAGWHIDQTRIASYGESGGAGASLWLAFHPDLADPKNADPILRQSSRLACAGALSTQFSYDMVRWVDEFGEDVTKRFAGNYTANLLYGLPDEESLLTSAGREIRADCDMLGLIAKGAPPVFLYSTRGASAITDSNQLLHHPRHAQLLYERCRELGVPVVAIIPSFGVAPPQDGPANLRDFLLHHLGANTPTTAASASGAP